MTAKVPASYKQYRTIWIVIHATLLVVLFLLVAEWYVWGGGDSLLADWVDRLTMLQYYLANAVPFPWE